jgi:hypothetical protein
MLLVERLNNQSTIFDKGIFNTVGIKPPFIIAPTTVASPYRVVPEFGTSREPSG